jgi:hypothetical protein
MKYLPYLIFPSLLLYGIKLNFSPVYPILIFSIIIYIGLILYGNSIQLSNDILAAVIFLIYVTIYKFSLEGNFINLILGITAYIIIRSTRKYNKLASLTKLIDFTLAFNLILLIIDTYYRFNNPITSEDQINSYLEVGMEFNIYKFSSLMFADSNAVGIASLSFGILSLYLYKSINEKKYLYFNLFYLLITFLTFSRSAIITYILIYLYVTIANKSKINRYLYYAFTLIVFTFGIEYLFNDDSFNSKLYIYSLFITNYIDDLTVVNFLIGLEFGGFGLLYGIDAHSIFVKYICELGVIGLILITIFIIAMKKISENIIIYGIFPIIIAGSSYYIYAGIPFIFVIFAIILNIDEYNEKQNEQNIKYNNT